tara:strand:+ start:146 stop:349 length:204 start_codon:yes stop_codon:yes gene_type:complete
MDNQKMLGVEKLMYFTGLTVLGFLGIIVSLILKANNIIVPGDETILIPSGMLFLSGLVAIFVCSIEA